MNAFLDSLCLKTSLYSKNALKIHHVFERYPYIKHGFPWWLSGIESSASAGNMVSIPGLGRSPSNPL